LANSDRNTATAADFRSSLEAPRDRFLSELLARALPSALRSAADFLTHFPPPGLMQALAGEPELRADVVQAATACKRKTALGKSIASATDDLEVALKVHDTTEEQVLECLPLDERVRLLPRPDVWNFIAEPILADKPDVAALVTHLLARALAHALVTPEQVVNAIGVSVLVEALPKSELTAVVDSVLAAPAKYSSADLLNVLHPAVLVRHLPLTLIWTRVVIPLVAEVHGFLADEQPEPVIESEAAAEGEEPHDEGAEPVEDNELVEDNASEEESAALDGESQPEASPVLPEPAAAEHIRVGHTDSERPLARPGSSPPALMTTKDQVLGVLRECQLKLGRLNPDAGLRELMISALIELDGPAYADRVRELNQVALRDLANLLCQEVERAHPPRAEQLKQILTGPNSVVRASVPPSLGPRSDSRFRG
jgi:hypothetical protein